MSWLAGRCIRLPAGRRAGALAAAGFGELQLWDLASVGATTVFVVVVVVSLPLSLSPSSLSRAVNVLADALTLSFAVILSPFVQAGVCCARVLAAVAAVWRTLMSALVLTRFTATRSRGGSQFGSTSA